ncbi:MAG: ribosomal protein S18 acetylase RimI-like enzyme [Myxococcota bacterium]|jgi:ribosomal protein S18 acetylase RimI-like enzyme
MGERDLRIRAYATADKEQVTALWEEVFPNDPPRNDPAIVIERKLGTQRELFLVGELRDQVAATVIGGYDGHRGWVYHLAVSPDHQRKHIGNEMMTAITKQLVALGCPKVNLQVRSTNHEVIAFYKTIGFEVEDRVSMGKHLSEG